MDNGVKMVNISSRMGKCVERLGDCYVGVGGSSGVVDLFRGDLLVMVLGGGQK